MKNKILITQFSVGPVYRDRLLHNLQTYSGYDYFDILIITDYVKTFNPISHKPNIFVQDVNELRKDFPWSIEFEIFPNEKDSDAKYLQEIKDRQIHIPTMMERFTFIWNKVYDYDGFVFMNCDVVPMFLRDYGDLELYFTNPNKNIIMSPGGNVKNTNIPALHANTIEINNRHKITHKEIINQYYHNDGNLRSFKIYDKSMIKPFFNLLNNICYDILVEKMYTLLDTHSVWDLHSEEIYSIALNLLNDDKVTDQDLPININDFFRCDNYPEDKFWSPIYSDMTPTIEGKKKFIEINYEQLKKYYNREFWY
jgi:hypothetical protein